MKFAGKLFRSLFALVALTLLAVASAPVHAQDQAQVVNNCGTLNGPAPSAGAVVPLTQDTTGKLCTSGAGGGGGGTVTQGTGNASNPWYFRPQDGGGVDATDTRNHALRTSPTNITFANTSTPLAGAGSFVDPSPLDSGVSSGSPEPFAYFNALFYADQGSATNGAVIEGSNDGATWTPAAQSTLSASTPLTLTVPVTFRYYHVKFTNGAAGQSKFVVTSSFTAN